MPSTASRQQVEGDEQAVVPPHHLLVLAIGRVACDAGQSCGVSPSQCPACVATRRSRRTASSRRPERLEEVLARKAERVGPDRVAVERGPHRARQAVRERVHRGVRNQHAGHAVHDRFSRPRRHRARRRGRRRPAPRPARCRSLRSPGRSAAAERPIECPDLLIGLPAEELHVGPGQRLQPRAFGAGARRCAAARRPDGSPQSPDRAAYRGPARTRSGKQGAGSGVRRGVIEVSVYWRIHNGRPAIIVSADPARNILRVREKAVHAPRGGGVPPGQTPPSPAEAAGCANAPT